MKRLMIVTVLGLLVTSAAGCRIGECWRYAWNSRFPKHQQTVVVADPCVMADPCSDPCGSACAPSGIMPMAVPAQ